MSYCIISAERKKQDGFSSMEISITPDGGITIQDHSRQDDRHKLIRRLQKLGVKTKAVFDSLCG